MTTVNVPDIGDFSNVPVIEIHVKPGDTIKADDPLVSLESDKATMEVPAPIAGVVAEVLVKIGDKVSQGSALITLQGVGTAPAPKTPKPDQAAPATSPAASAPPQAQSQSPSRSSALPVVGVMPLVDFDGVHASPSVRRLARELDINLNQIKGSGANGRVTKDDVKSHLGRASGPAAVGTGIPEIPAQDFSKFGPVETKALSRLKKLSGPHLHRAWLNICLLYTSPSPRD